MSEPLGMRRAPLAGVEPHPMLRADPPTAIWICDGEVPDTEGATSFQVAPERWWVVVDGDAPATPPSVTDVSHGMTRIRVHGSNVRELLSSGITLDLHPDEFTEGDAAATLFRSIFVVLVRTGDSSFDLYTPRSTARSLWEWMVDAAEGLPANMDSD